MNAIAKLEPDVQCFGESVVKWGLAQSRQPDWLSNMAEKKVQIEVRKAWSAPESPPPTVLTQTKIKKILNAN